VVAFAACCVFAAEDVLPGLVVSVLYDQLKHFVVLAADCANHLVPCFVQQMTSRPKMSKQPLGPAFHTFFVVASLFGM
jgi:hypothetical protein